jgi:nucleotide-binding universal stress UspA family protein
MAKPILVAYDPGSADSAPVAFGIRAARFSGAPLIVGAVHADHAAIGRGHHGADTGLADDAGEQIEQVRRELEAADIDADCRALKGMSAPRALHQAAEELGAGLLVVGSSSHRSVLHGSTAERVLHGAPCPVAVVPSGFTPNGPAAVFGVAFIDTAEGRAALRGGLALARRAGATLRVLSAAKPHGYHDTYGGGPGVEATTFSEIGGALRAAAEHAVAEATAGDDDVDIDPDVSVQDPAEFLVACSHRLDLLVCGSRGYGPRRAVLLGGVTHRVTVEAACPVIVLARGVETALEELGAPPAPVSPHLTGSGPTG